jgi:tetratricopeptide (TPR) repeat protein
MKKGDWAKAKDDLAQAQERLDKAFYQGPTPGLPELRREVAVAQFEWALQKGLWWQAEEKLERAGRLGLSDDEIVKKTILLKQACSSQGKRILDRIVRLMSDARAGWGKTVSEEDALCSIIAMKDPVAVTTLLTYLKDPNLHCRLLATKALGWMEDPLVVSELLPLIKEKTAEGKPNPLEIQVQAIQALIRLVPDDSTVYEALSWRLGTAVGEVDRALYERVKNFYDPYAARMDSTRRQAPPAGEALLPAWEWMEQGLHFYQDQANARAAYCFEQVQKTSPELWKAWGEEVLLIFGQKGQETFYAALKAVKKKAPNLEAIQREMIAEGRKWLSDQVPSALGQAQKNPREWMVRGQYRLKGRRYEEAAEDLEMALKLDPSLGPQGLYKLLIEIAELRGQTDLKTALLRRWIQAAPHSQAAVSLGAQELLHSENPDPGQLQTALGWARKATELTAKKDPEALALFALALFKNGQATEAIETQKKALDILPSNSPPKTREKYKKNLQTFQGK